MCQDELNKVSMSVNDLQETIKKLSSNLSDMKGDPKDKIYLQLHEQYAINNNANLSTIMALVIALIGVIGYYGYVYINTEAVFKNWAIYYNVQDGTYYLDALILIYIASVSILAILFCLCTYQGVAQRKEQFIVYDIRKKYLTDENETDENVIDEGKIHLPDSYHPYKKTGLSIIQGLYGELVKVFIIVFIVLSFSLMHKVYDSIEKLWLPLFTTIIVLILLCFNYYTKQYASYIDRQIEYEEKNNGNRLCLRKKDCKDIKNCTCSVSKICEYEERVINKKLSD